MSCKNEHSCFKKEAEAAGFKVEHYNGRNFWKGPAVRVESKEEALSLIRATSVTLQWDNLGLGFIYYPATINTKKEICHICGKNETCLGICKDCYIEIRTTNGRSK